MSEALIAESEVLGLLREGLEGEADRIWFRSGHAPLAVGHGFIRKLAFRSLASDDVAAVAELMLLSGYVPEAICEDPTDAAHEIPMLCELPGQAILETKLLTEGTELAVVVEIARPLQFPGEVDFF
jgi:hypothetical protein